MMRMTYAALLSQRISSRRRGRKRTSLPSVASLSTLLLRIFIFLIVPAHNAAAADNNYCIAAEDKQFIVVVATAEPLGLRLSDKLEILEFVADAQGRSRAVEAAGLAEIGDRLIAVNDAPLAGMTFQVALERLRDATLPKRLRFQTYDGRCMVASGVTNNATSNAPNASPGVGAPKVYDYVVLSVGTVTEDETFYAVLSSDGQPPSCLFRELVVADPTHACSPLKVNATDKYVIVPSIFGCPAHQKAAMAQEGGAKGMVFIQRMGEKPQQVVVPRDLPKPIQLPLVMVSMDSGVQILQTVANINPTQTLQLRLVFSEECASDKYSIHPQDDPLQRSAVNRIESATAGFLSLTVASTAKTMLNAAAFEFLKPTPKASDGTNAGNASTSLPLGQYPIFFLSPQVNACEQPAGKQASQVAFWEAEVEEAFVAVHLRLHDCSVVAQVEFFGAKKALGVVFVDATFPSTASQPTTRIAAQQTNIPFVFVSPTAMATMRSYGHDSGAVHTLVEFTGENALQHQWRDLSDLSNAANWPTSARRRERLFFRMLKDQASIAQEVSEQALVKHERYEALVASYDNAKRFYEAKTPAQTRAKVD